MARLNSFRDVIQDKFYNTIYQQLSEYVEEILLDHAIPPFERVV